MKEIEIYKALTEIVDLFQILISSSNNYSKEAVDQLTKCISAIDKILPEEK